ncbi:sensor domain-containing diguanylate cyclase [Bacillus shivajii]|uniref:sensor domain-containing diguanylate cyclase n=1 Tax=Bacillus shivajii TaxID=1983719 RepID=UPI001CFA617C|nr:sensor domain-containing diguanylate cyclase [Bacillus shivajii]UCZ54031.1 sensor domain-containing diguanylate cyclase [Bacillus shivajii]
MFEIHYMIFAMIGLIGSVLFMVLYIKIHNQQKRIFRLVENSQDLVYQFQVEPEHKFLYVSPSIEKMLKVSVKDVYANPRIPFDLIHPEDMPKLQNKLSGKVDYSQPILQRWEISRGIYGWFEEYATPVYKHGKLVKIEGIVRNVSDKIRLQKELEFKSFHDELTGLKNRTAFRERFHYLNEIDLSVGLMLCDVNDLKATNDNFGHLAGDNLIKETASILKGCVDDYTSVYRIGGDEFVLLIEGTSRRYVEHKYELLLSLCEHHNEESTNSQNIYFAVGYEHSRSSMKLMDHLFKQADEAMYEDKRKTKQQLFV